MRAQLSRCVAEREEQRTVAHEATSVLASERAERATKAAAWREREAQLTSLLEEQHAEGAKQREVIDQLDTSLEEKPKGRAHRSSLADTAASRSARDMFKKAAAAPPPKSGKEVVQRAKFDAKLEKFEKGAPAVGVAGARGKAAMFEAAGKQPTAPAVKKTWASAGGGGNYKKKTAFEGGVAAKKTFADLP